MAASQQEVSSKRGDDGPARPGDELLAAARAGDQDAFAAVVERHRRELLVHCYRMTGSLTDAEDLVQETFLRAWRGLGGFAGRSSLRAWLYRIATNVCLDALAAVARGDLAAVAAVLAEDVRASMPPFTFWFHGRDHVLAALAESWDPSSPDYVGHLRGLPTAANGQLAAAGYAHRPGDAEYHPFAVSVLDVQDGRVQEIVAFLSQVSTR